MTTNPHHTGGEGYNFHLMYLTNTEAGDLVILPTHRLIRGIENFDVDRVVRQLQEDFMIKSFEDPDGIQEAIRGMQWAFGILFKDRTYEITLKPESFPKMTWHFPEVVKALDLTVLHFFIIERVLGIPGKLQRSSEKIDFERSFTDCLQNVLQGDAQLAIITQGVSIEDVKTVCQSGSTMPQKSTYFYPKVICGFLFSSIKEDEFQTPAYSRF